jgi:hypothetical protein
MATTISDRPVKIRKPHSCFSCKQKFAAGTIMRKWVGTYEGDFGQVYYCATCEQIMHLCPCDPGEGWPEEFTIGFYREGIDTPEKVLEMIKAKTH